MIYYGSKELQASKKGELEFPKGSKTERFIY